MEIRLEPQITDIAGATMHPGRDVLFERVDRFNFVHPARGRMVVRNFSLPGVDVATVRSTGHDIALNEGKRATVLLPLKGRIGVETQHGELEVKAGGAMLLPPGYRTTRVRDASGEFLAAVALVQEPLWQNSIATKTPGRVVASISDNASARALQGFLCYFFNDCEKHKSPLLQSSMVRLSSALIRELLDGLDRALPETYPAISIRQVQMAEEIMCARYEEPLTVEEIAREVGVSSRALQAAFRALRGRSPYSMLTFVRLTRARELLMRDDPSLSVSQIALASGFAHLGRFAALYRKHFGETPSATRLRARP